MAFNSDKFTTHKFEHRTRTVPVPELKDWFDKGDKPIWTVRGLTGLEIAKASEVAGKRDISTAILEGLLTMKAADIKEAVERMVGRGKDIPEVLAKQIEHLTIASVDPVCNEDLAIRLNKVFPTVFLNLNTQIMILSGQGMSPGKSKPFGKTKNSKGQ